MQYTVYTCNISNFNIHWEYLPKSLLYKLLILRRWVILSSQVYQIFIEKNQKCILVIALNPKILYMHISNCSVN